MPTPALTTSKKIAIAAGVALVVLAVGLAIAFFVVAPGMAETTVRNKIDSASERLGLDIESGAIETTGFGGVEVHDIVVSEPGAEEPLVTVKLAGARLDVLELLTGDRVISSVWTEGVDVYATREPDGGFDLARIARRIQEKRAAGTSDDDTEATSSGGFLRMFGGEFPDVEIDDVDVHVRLAEGAPAFPLKLAHLDSADIEGDADTFSIEGRMSFTPYQSPHWSLPENGDFEAVVRRDLVPETLHLAFDRKLAISGVGPFPFLRFGFKELDLSEDRTLKIGELHLGVTRESGGEPFLEVASISMKLAKITSDVSKLRVKELEVNEPRLDLHYDAGGASALTDLNHMVRAPRAHYVASRARRLAGDIAADQKPEEPLPEDVVEESPEEEALSDEEESDEKENDEEESDGGVAEVFASYAPERIVVKGFEARVEDARDVPVANPYDELEAREGHFELVHRPLESEFKLDVELLAVGDGEERGRVDASIGWHYTEKTFDAKANIEALDLSWVAQMLGQRAYEHVRGGTLRGNFEMQPGGGRAVEFKGLASLENAEFAFDALAEEPVRDFTASYSFAGTYDPEGKTPEPKLLKKPLFKESHQGPKPSKGSVIFRKGIARMNGFEGRFRPAIYGTEALPALPARFDLAVDLPRTDVMKLFNAVPTAIQGDIAGIEMTGTLAWKFDVEVPLHRAGEMEWNSEASLQEFELVSIPEAVDVKKLMEGMELTIVDENFLTDTGEPWQRTVSLPPMKPIPASWLIENTYLTLEKIDSRRRRRQWPPSPDPQKSMLPRTIIRSPQYWTTNTAVSKAADKPWVDGAPVRSTEESPYGPYVFVPLHYISGFMPRAVVTTEDNSFFKHNGFNFFALKESVEDNIEAGRFRRGASTISMQLVKNAFLSRKKLLSRKIQEAFLVWLMEKVVDVPKFRIMETYLNIIEFGPGIFGIHDAAVHYFGKRPDALSIGEVAWLVTIIPNPKKYHVYYDRGAISGAWFRKMHRYIDVMWDRGRISEAQMLAACLEKPQFYKPGPSQPLLRREPAVDAMEKWGPYIDEWARRNGRNVHDELIFDDREKPAEALRLREKLEAIRAIKDSGFVPPTEEPGLPSFGVPDAPLDSGPEEGSDSGSKKRRRGSPPDTTDPTPPPPQ